MRTTKSIFVAAAIAFTAAFLAAPANAAIPTPTSQEHEVLDEGVKYSKYNYDSLYGGVQRIYVLEIDLSNPNIEAGIAVCPDGVRKNTATQGKSNNAIAAVNLGLFGMGSSPSVSVGLVKAQGKIYTSMSSVPNDPTEGYLWIDGNRAGVARDNKFNLGLGANIRYGYPVLVQNGEVLPELQNYKGGDTSLVNGIHERTALGVTSDRQTLYMVVFDRDDSDVNPRGVSCKNLANFMKALGCYEAWNADGGGSSTIWTSKHGLMNYPSGGTWQRPVHDIAFVRKKQILTPESNGNPSAPSKHLNQGLTPKARR